MLTEAKPSSILVVSVGYHIIFNDFIVNNCFIITLFLFKHIKNKFKITIFICK